MLIPFPIAFLTGAVLFVQCLWHGSQFDAGTGKLKAGPAKNGIAASRVTEENGDVKLFL